MRQRMLDLSKNLWLDAVDQASPNGNRCIFDDKEYGDGDRDSDNRVKDRQGDTDDTNEAFSQQSCHQGPFDYPFPSK
jgi:hypothetical protein